MKTRPAPGDSDTPDTSAVEADNVASTDERAQRDGNDADSPVSDDLRALFPESGAATRAAQAAPAVAVRPRPRQAFGDFMRNLSLDDRLGRIALSIVLAILLWFYV